MTPPVPIIASLFRVRIHPTPIMTTQTHCSHRFDGRCWRTNSAGTILTSYWIGLPRVALDGHPDQTERLCGSAGGSDQTMAHTILFLG